MILQEDAYPRVYSDSWIWRLAEEPRSPAILWLQSFSQKMFRNFNQGRSAYCLQVEEVLYLERSSGARQG